MRLLRISGETVLLSRDAGGSRSAIASEGLSSEPAATPGSTVACAPPMGRFEGEDSSAAGGPDAVARRRRAAPTHPDPEPAGA